MIRFERRRLLFTATRTNPLRILIHEKTPTSLPLLSITVLLILIQPELSERKKGERQTKRGSVAKFLTKGGKASEEFFSSMHLIILPPFSPPHLSVLFNHVSKLNRNFRLFLLFPGKWRPADSRFLSSRTNNKWYRIPRCRRRLRLVVLARFRGIVIWIIEVNSYTGRVTGSRTCRKIKDNRARSIFRAAFKSSRDSD